jgi:hypothetical protein
MKAAHPQIDLTEIHPRDVVHSNFATAAAAPPGDIVISFGMLPLIVRESDVEALALHPETGLPMLPIEPLVAVSIPAVVIPSLIAALRDQLAVYDLLMAEFSQMNDVAHVSDIPLSSRGLAITESLRAEIESDRRVSE